MAIYIPSGEVNEVFYGNKKVKAVYKGNIRIWPEVEHSDVWIPQQYLYVQDITRQATCVIEKGALPKYGDYEANTGQASCPVDLVVFQRKGNILSDGSYELFDDPDGTNKRYVLFDTLDNPEGPTTIQPVTRLILGWLRNGETPYDPGFKRATELIKSAPQYCKNKLDISGTYTCETQGINEGGTAKTLDSYLRSEYPSPSENPEAGDGNNTDIELKYVPIRNDAKDELKIATIVPALGCKKETRIANTCLTAASINPHELFGLSYNGTVNASSGKELFNGQKKTTSYYAVFICSETDPDIPVAHGTESDGTDPITITDKNYCGVTESNIVECLVSDNDYTGMGNRIYSYYNKIDGVAETEPSATISEEISTATCPIFNASVDNLPEYISFTGATGSFIFSAARNCILNVGLGTAALSIGTSPNSLGTSLNYSTPNLPITVYYKVANRFNDTYQTYLDTSLSLIATSTVGPETQKMFYMKQRGAYTNTTTNTEETNNRCAAGGPSAEQIFPATWPVKTVYVNGLPDTATLSSGVTQKRVTGLNTGEEYYTETIIKTTYLYENTTNNLISYKTENTDSTTKQRTNSNCDNRVTNPSRITSFTCETSAGANTGYALKTLNIYRRQNPKTNSYIQTGISPATTTYRYSDSSNCENEKTVEIRIGAQNNTELETMHSYSLEIYFLGPDNDITNNIYGYINFPYTALYPREGATRIITLYPNGPISHYSLAKNIDRVQVEYSENVDNMQILVDNAQEGFVPSIVDLGVSSVTDTTITYQSLDIIYLYK